MRGDCTARVFDVECVSGWSGNDAIRFGGNDCRPTSVAAWPGATTRRPRATPAGSAAIALMTLLAAVFSTLVDASSPNAPTVEFRAAERTLPNGNVTRTPLPDLHRFAHVIEAPQQVRYRMAADLGPVKPHAQALYFPGLRSTGPRLDQRPCGAGRAAPPRPASAAQHRCDPPDPHPGRVPARRQQRDRADRRRSRRRQHLARVARADQSPLGDAPTQDHARRDRPDAGGDDGGLPGVLRARALAAPALRADVRLLRSCGAGVGRAHRVDGAADAAASRRSIATSGGPRCTRSSSRCW